MLNENKINYEHAIKLYIYFKVELKDVDPSYFSNFTQVKEQFFHLSHEDT